ncbi:MAG: 2-hydroxyacyl-CoA dehydratase [Planctomycetaceae bacterium]|nr:2-hydroxyacyl-CoA dehydratase [Planctomycetaceae bacterium]
MDSDPIGITTTVPVEIIFAAGRIPVDLNNIFVADPDANRLVAYAEERGFPQSACAWTKGLYGAIHSRGLKEVVGVIEGDCSNTYALCEILESEGITVHPYGYPASRRPDDLEEALRRFAARLGTTLEAAEAIKPQLDEVRAIAGEIYALAGQGRVHSGELFGALLNTSDFFGNPDKCRADLEAMLAAARAAPEPATPPLRLSCCGVPTILADLWDVFEGLGARFVDHEVPRQFALLDGIGKGMVETYIRYTYPYDVFRRIEDVTTEAERQGARGLIHYVQSFCHRQIEDRLWRERVSLPILTLEADRPGRVDERTRTRIEAFMERLE